MTKEKYPDDFSELCELFKSPQSVPDAIDKIHKNNFFRWLHQPKGELNRPSEFVNAKEKLIKKELIRPRSFSPKTSQDLVDKYWLELLCAIIILYFVHNSETLDKTVSRNEKHREVRAAMTFIRDEWRASGTALFENCMVKSVFYGTLDALLANSGFRPYWSGKQHDNLAREIMTKRVLELLYRRFLQNCALVRMSSEPTKMKMTQMNNLNKYPRGVILYNGELYNMNLEATSSISLLSKHGQHQENIENLKKICEKLPENVTGDSLSPVEKRNGYIL